MARQAEFEKRAATADYRVYDLVSAVAPEIARLQTELAGLHPSWATASGWRVVFGWAAGDEQDRLNSLIEEAGKLDHTIGEWTRPRTPLASLPTGSV